MMTTSESDQNGAPVPLPGILARLPSEVQLLVFGGLSDLDDAVALSRTCGHYRQLFRENKRAIARAIVLSSDVYKYDLHVVRLITACSSLAEVYRRYGSDLTDEQRPSEAAFFDCVETPLSNGTLTNELLDRICLHWEDARVLRRLYLDPHIAAECDAVRLKIANEDIAIPAPGVTILSKDWLQADFKIGPDHTFKERFHKALCLNTIATLGHILAKASFRNTRNGMDALHLLTWTHERITIAGAEIELTLKERIECVEVDEFLYAFLLPKLLPLKKFQAWAEETSGIWSLGCIPNMAGEENFYRWSLFLLNCRVFFQPLDLVNLFTSQSRGPHALEDMADYPPDKELYMLEKGIYDHGEGADGGGQWEMVGWKRRLKLDNWDWACLFEDADLLHEYTATEKDQWWDRVRGKSGSPFHRDFYSNAQHVFQEPDAWRLAHPFMRFLSGLEPSDRNSVSSLEG